MTVAEKLENSTRYSRFILSSTSQAARRQMQVGRPNAIGSTSCSCVAWLADVTQSSGSRRTTSDCAARIVVRDDGEVEIAAFDMLDQARRRLADHRQLDTRVGARETRHDFGQEAVGIVVGHADADHAFERPVVEGGQRLAVQVHHAARIGKQPLALLGQPVRAAVLLEQRLADPLLQPAHLHGNRRLRAVHLVGRAGEAARVGDGDEGLQLVEVERRGHAVTYHNC